MISQNNLKFLYISKEAKSTFQLKKKKNNLIYIVHLFCHCQNSVIIILGFY